MTDPKPNEGLCRSPEEFAQAEIDLAEIEAAVRTLARHFLDEYAPPDQSEK